MKNTKNYPKIKANRANTVYYQNLPNQNQPYKI